MCEKCNDDGKCKNGLTISVSVKDTEIFKAIAKFAFEIAAKDPEANRRLGDIFEEHGYELTD